MDHRTLGEQTESGPPSKLRSGRSLWSELAGAAPIYRELSGDTECEVLVVGAGITGALIAHHLAKVGVQVVLVDRHELGRGSTAASTGLLQYEIDTPLIELIAKVGEESAVRAYRRGLTAIDEIEQLVAELDGDCGFARRESLYFCSHAGDHRDLEQEYECRRHFGFHVELLTGGQLLEQSTIRAEGAIRSYGDAQVDPLQLTFHLIKSAVAAGARVHARTKVERIEETDSQVVAHAAQGRIRAGKIVYAAGYESQRFLPRPAGSLHSTYALASRANLVVPGWPAESLLWETARPYFYGRRTADGRVIVGGEDTDFADDHSRDSLVERKIEKLVLRFQSLFPGVDLSPEFSWAGTFGETSDGLAYIGQLPDRPRAYFALGYGGNGITFSVIAAQLIADLYRGRPNPDAEVFRFGR